MKGKLFGKIAITGALCALLMFPSFAQNTTESIKPIGNISSETAKLNHWAEPYIDQLSTIYGVDSVFKDKSLNAAIDMDDFKNLVNLVIDGSYEGTPDSITREALVYESARIWANNTGNNLDEIATIKMIIYSDTERIDSKYNHGITVAYMKNIAKGKGNRIFDPKAPTTYGELATIVYNTSKAISEEKGSLPIREGMLETRASYEIAEGKVIFDFELFSHYAEPKDLYFSSGQQFELIITDEAGKEVYRFSDDKFFTMALVYKTIHPGESFKWQDTWDMTDKDGNKLTSGKYKALIQILAQPADDNGRLDESQLTTTLEFSFSQP